jgi:hypothetical protein
MAFNITSPNTGASVSGQIDPSILYKKTLDTFEQSEDIFQQMEGAGANALIQTKTDTSKGVGQKMKFRNRAGFYQEPKFGDELYEDTDDFEALVLGDYDLEVDWLSHATRITERTEELMGLRGELESGLPIEQGRWLGRLKTEQLLMMFLNKGHATSYQFASGRSGVNALKSSDILDWDEVIQMVTQLKNLGGRPALMTQKGKNGCKCYNILSTTDALFSLENDSDWRQIISDAGSRGDTNYLFNGGWANVRGNFFTEYNPIDHDGHGAIGSPLNPKAVLGEAISAGTGVFTLKGGGSAAAAAKTKIAYFKYFSNYAYRWTPADVITPAATTRYFLVVNPANAAVDPNKIGMYSFQVNGGNTITVLKRLGSAAAGDRVTTLGDVTWDTGVWAGLHTDVHPVGSTIVECNSKGVPIGRSIVMGAAAAYRGYGKYRNQRSEDSHNGGFVRDVFIRSVFGQTPRQDVQGRTPGFLTLTHAVQYAGLPIPSNIT